ncbi:MAG: NAD-dependent epimerase/dehydratase family protein [Bacteroidia bacterium]
MKIIVTGGSGFIGTNLIERLKIVPENKILNIDIKPPKLHSHINFWKDCDILNSSLLSKIIEEFRPEIVIHLAARTDTDPKCVLEDYKVNYVGTQNLIDGLANINCLQRVVFTSTQFVNQYHGVPKDDEDFSPHTKYGESKVLMEQMIRKGNFSYTWTIIRPTNIWGPWHIRYPFEFWKVLSKGMYFHPGRKPVIRSYGYVGNVVWQIIKILEADKKLINKQVFYVGDEPLDLYDWVNGFSNKQIGKNVKVIPRFVVQLMAFAGDLFATIGLKFPITSSRFKSMTNSNTAPMAKTFQVLGEAPYSLDEGITETVNWLKKHHPDLIKISE